MNKPRVLIVLTLVNVGLLIYQLSPSHVLNAATSLPILRGSGIEIVDSEGRLRAQLKLEPADASFKMPDGKVGYPETVILRLITPDGKPRVKLTTSEEGSGLMLLGESDSTQAILKADGAETSLTLRNTEAVQRICGAIGTDASIAFGGGRKNLPCCGGRGYSTSCCR